MDFNGRTDGRMAEWIGVDRLSRIMDAVWDFTEANEGNEEPIAGSLLLMESHDIVNVIH